MRLQTSHFLPGQLHSYTNNGIYHDNFSSNKTVFAFVAGLENTVADQEKVPQIVL